MTLQEILALKEAIELAMRHPYYEEHLAEGICYCLSSLADYTLTFGSAPYGYMKVQSRKLHGESYSVLWYPMGEIIKRKEVLQEVLDLLESNLIFREE